MHLHSIPITKPIVLQHFRLISFNPVLVFIPVKKYSLKWAFFQATGNIHQIFYLIKTKRYLSGFKIKKMN